MLVSCSGSSVCLPTTVYLGNYLLDCTDPLLCVNKYTRWLAGKAQAGTAALCLLSQVMCECQLCASVMAAVCHKSRRSSPEGAPMNAEQHTTRTLKALQSTSRVNRAEQAYARHNNGRHAKATRRQAPARTPPGASHHCVWAQYKNCPVCVFPVHRACAHKAQQRQTRCKDKQARPRCVCVMAPPESPECTGPDTIEQGGKVHQHRVQVWEMQHRINLSFRTSQYSDNNGGRQSLVLSSLDEISRPWHLTGHLCPPFEVPLVT